MTPTQPLKLELSIDVPSGSCRVYHPCVKMMTNNFNAKHSSRFTFYDPITEAMWPDSFSAHGALFTMAAASWLDWSEGSCSFDGFLRGEEDGALSGVWELFVGEWGEISGFEPGSVPKSDFGSRVCLAGPVTTVSFCSSNFCTSTMRRSNYDSSDPQTISSSSNGLEIVSEWD